MLAANKPILIMLPPWVWQCGERGWTSVSICGESDRCRHSGLRHRLRSGACLRWVNNGPNSAHTGLPKYPREADIHGARWHVSNVPILLQKSVAADGRSAIWLGKAGVDPPALTLSTQLHATQYTGPRRVAAERPAMQVVAGSEQWRPEQTHPEHLVGLAVEAGRASGCA